MTQPKDDDDRDPLRLLATTLEQALRMRNFDKLRLELLGRGVLEADFAKDRPLIDLLVKLRTTLALEEGAAHLDALAHRMEALDPDFYVHPPKA